MVERGVDTNDLPSINRESQQKREKINNRYIKKEKIKKKDQEFNIAREKIESL